MVKKRNNKFSQRSSAAAKWYFLAEIINSDGTNLVKATDYLYSIVCIDDEGVKGKTHNIILETLTISHPPYPR